MEFDLDKPLEPQLDKVFMVRKHGTTVPSILREIAHRLDKIDARIKNINKVVPGVYNTDTEILNLSKYK